MKIIYLQNVFFVHQPLCESPFKTALNSLSQILIDRCNTIEWKMGRF